MQNTTVREYRRICDTAILVQDGYHKESTVSSLITKATAYTCTLNAGQVLKSLYFRFSFSCRYLFIYLICSSFFLLWVILQSSFTNIMWGIPRRFVGALPWALLTQLARFLTFYPLPSLPQSLVGIHGCLSVVFTRYLGGGLWLGCYIDLAAEEITPLSLLILHLPATIFQLD